MRNRLILVALSAGTLVVPAASHAADLKGDPARGQARYESSCGGCHSLDQNRIGPAHRGVVGRAPGRAPGYAYSAALRKPLPVWTPARLDAWLRDPPALIPGTKMTARFPDPQQRADIIAYLKVESSRPGR
jgi:cytochrome c